MEDMKCVISECVCRATFCWWKEEEFKRKVEMSIGTNFIRVDVWMNDVKCIVIKRLKSFKTLTKVCLEPLKQTLQYLRPQWSFIGDIVSLSKHHRRKIEFFLQCCTARFLIVMKVNYKICASMTW